MALARSDDQPYILVVSCSIPCCVLSWMRSRKAKSLSQLFTRKLPIASSAVERMSPSMLRRSPSHGSASRPWRIRSSSCRACCNHGARPASRSPEWWGSVRRRLRGIISGYPVTIKSFAQSYRLGEDSVVFQSAYNPSVE